MNAPNPFHQLQGFDSQHLSTLYGSDPAMAIEMFEEYLKEVPKDLDDLAKSFNSGDVQLFKTYLHKLKPGFTYVGLLCIAQEVTELEAACQQSADLAPHRDRFHSLLARIEASTATVSAAVQSLAASLN